jgi:PAS domain S-box-containing protein
MNKRHFQKAFFSRIGELQAFRELFEHLPDLYFFVKDRQGRMVAASSTILDRLGVKSEDDLIGTTDHDVYPRHLADAYVADDSKVFRSGAPLVNRLEVWFDESRRLNWCVTTKVPVRDRQGAIIGLVGVSRPDAGRNSLQAANEATAAVDFLRKNAHRAVGNVELAEQLEISARTLNRKIQEAFGVSPYELSLRIRIQKAAERLLLSDDDIATIALSHGFSDQSTFTQHFRKRMGATPKKFRDRHST